MKPLLSLLITVGLLAAASWIYRFTVPPKPPKLPQVAATIYPLYDLVRQVAGDSLEVTLLAPPGTNPAQASPSPSKTLTFAIGGNLDNPGPEAVLVNTNLILLPDNPYYYLSLKNAVNITHTIAEQLTQKFPQNQELYEQNAQDLISRIQTLDQEAADWASASATKTVVADKPWQYVATDYGLSFTQASGSATLDPFGGSITTDTYLGLMEQNLRQLFLK